MGCARAHTAVQRRAPMRRLGEHRGRVRRRCGTAAAHRAGRGVRPANSSPARQTRAVERDEGGGAARREGAGERGERAAGLNMDSVPVTCGAKSPRVTHGVVAAKSPEAGLHRGRSAQFLDSPSCRRLEPENTDRNKRDEQEFLHCPVHAIRTAGWVMMRCPHLSEAKQWQIFPQPRTKHG